MFLSQIKTFPKTQFWRYILGFLLMALCYTIGQIPLLIGWVLKKGAEYSEEGISYQFIKGFENLQDTPQRDLMKILPNNETLMLALLMFVFTLVGIIVALKWFHNLKLKHITTARHKVDWKRILFSFGILALFSIAITFIGYWTTPEEYIWNFRWKPFLSLFLIIVLLMPIQTSVEEWMFRGYLMQGIYVAAKHKLFLIYLLTTVSTAIIGFYLIYNPDISLLGKGGFIATLIIIWKLTIKLLIKTKIYNLNFYKKINSFFNSRLIPLLFTSIIFGLMHLANPEMEELGYFAMLFYIGTGLFLGIITLMDDGLELALGFHAANNMITALLVTADYSVLQTDAILKQIGKPEVGLQILAPVCILYPIFLIVFARKYKWTDWKERLLGNI